MILFFDTETTGLIKEDLPSEHPSQPHMVELSAILCESDGTKRHSIDMIVRPNGFEIPQVVVDIHGIDTALALRVGVPLHVVLNSFLALLEISDRLIAHNIDFDRKIMKAALHRTPGFDPLLIDSREHLCTMKEAQKVTGRRQKLRDLYKHFTGKEPPAQHSSMGDCIAVREVYHHLAPPPPRSLRSGPPKAPARPPETANAPATMTKRGVQRPDPAAQAQARDSLKSDKTDELLDDPMSF